MIYLQLPNLGEFRLAPWFTAGFIILFSIKTNWYNFGILLITSLR